MRTNLFIFLMLSICFISPALWAQDKPTFEDARMIIEFNSTSQDIGVQFLIDAEIWDHVFVVNPTGNKIFEVFGRGTVKNFGLSELFSESDEPSLDETSMQEFLSKFPAGQYKFFGTTPDGENFEGTTTFTHNIPDGPSIVSPARNGKMPLNKAIIQWDPVTTPAGIQIAGYQVVIEKGNPVRALQIDLPATATSLKVPPEFLQSGKQYKFEVLAKEVGGNQTITEWSFRTE
jgi:cbb3-type cytochrome oxidase subunit 3